MRFSFSKSERIVSQKLIDELFTGDESHSLVAFPIRAVYKDFSQTSAHACLLSQSEATERNLKPQILTSVPKKRFKHAVDRNRVKRQLREAYRRHKHLLDGRSVAIAFIWLTDAHFPSDVVDQRVRSLLIRISKAKSQECRI